MPLCPESISSVSNVLVRLSTPRHSTRVYKHYSFFYVSLRVTYPLLIDSTGLHITRVELLYSSPSELCIRSYLTLNYDRLPNRCQLDIDEVAIYWRSKTMFLNLMFRALKIDTSLPRIKAFVKRLFQVRSNAICSVYFYAVCRLH